MALNVPLKRFLLAKWMSLQAAAQAIGIYYNGLSLIVNGWRKPTAGQKAKLIKAIGRKRFRQFFPDEVKSRNKQGAETVTL
ncbi:MAG TPA: hypothetical protein VEQ38_24390 [Verrucomicrobiae bacterium]|nr:hypothetical protein [Verrucomicrobiae bacterium]